jgi:hypothetical protein
MNKQGALPFSYECEPTESGMTALAGLPAYLELATVAKLADSLQRHLEGCHLKEQGWTDTQIIIRPLYCPFINLHKIYYATNFGLIYLLTLPNIML